MVGHSFGGMLVRFYAHEYPGEVAGMVILDSVHEEQSLRFPPTVQAGLQKLSEQSRQQYGFFRVLAKLGLIALDPARVPVHPRLPEKTAKTYQGLVASNAKFFNALSREIEANDESHAQVRAARIMSLGKLPLTVLTHGQADLIPASVNLSFDEIKQFESVWQQLQAELVTLSPAGKLVVVKKSGHNIQYDQPELVVSAIRQVWQKARMSRE